MKMQVDYPAAYSPNAGTPSDQESHLIPPENPEAPNETFEEWNRETGAKKLPERVGSSTPSAKEDANQTWHKKGAKEPPMIKRADSMPMMNDGRVQI
jgi:hypothetical protein